MVSDAGTLQTTLRRPFELAGIGLHGGLPARIRVEPAAVDTGIVFRCVQGEVPALLPYVTDTARCTAISLGRARVETVEHLMATLFALGVTNARVTVLEGVEMPVLDGSARPIVEAVRASGVQAIPGTVRKQVQVTAPLYVRGEDCVGVALPHDRLRVTVIVDFPPPVGGEVVDVADVRAEFADRVAPSRTPGFVREWEMLKNHGLALGASAENVLPIHDDGYGDELRVPNEVATHKLLDLIGDLALVGADIAAHVITNRGGHALNHALGRAIVTAATGGG